LHLLFVAAAAAADHFISATIADFELEICCGSVAILPECRNIRQTLEGIWQLPKAPSTALIRGRVAYLGMVGLNRC
jgi:hypothetical protein